ncbi:MAG: hypothetical protein WAN43_19570 [Rhodomicrobium sp.]|jgi:hypothetical protein
MVSLRILAIMQALAVSLLAAGAAAAEAQDADVNAYIAQAPIAGLPPGGYAQWSEEQRRTAFKRIGGFCQYMCLGSYGNASFPNVAAAERAKAEAKVCLGACIVNHVPPDYPQRSGMRGDLQADFDKAKELGSKMKWPLPGR